MSHPKPLTGIAEHFLRVECYLNHVLCEEDCQMESEVQRMRKFNLLLE